MKQQPKERSVLSEPGPKQSATHELNSLLMNESFQDFKTDFQYSASRRTTLGLVNAELLR